MLLDRFVQHLVHVPELSRGTVLVAVSGGSDSVALLHLMHRSAVAARLEAAHVHHGVRGAEADADARFCETLCDRLSVPFHLLRADLPDQPDQGREGTWRKLRYRALLNLAHRRDLRTVATGHHADDVAEGVLLQVLRGAGPRALAGIAVRTPAGVVRPLLVFTKAELRSWLEDCGLRWREDSSNRDPGHLRNRVRMEVLPTLETVAPAVRRHLVSLAGALAEDERTLRDEVRRRALWIDPWHPEGGVAVAAVASMPSSLRRRWLLAQAERSGVPAVSRRHLQLLDELLASARPRSITLGGRWRLRSARRRLWLEPPAPPEPYDLPLTPGTTVQLPLRGWSVCARVPGDGGAEAPVWCSTIAARDGLRVRSPKTGDRVGAGSRDGPDRPLSRLLAETLPRHLRKAWPVVSVADTILWIPGVWRQAPAAGEGRLVVEVSRR